MIEQVLTNNQYYLTREQFNSRKTAGTLEVGAEYYITDDKFDTYTVYSCTGGDDGTALSTLANTWLSDGVPGSKKILVSGTFGTGNISLTAHDVYKVLVIDFSMCSQLVDNKITVANTENTNIVLENFSQKFTTGSEQINVSGSGNTLFRDFSLHTTVANGQTVIASSVQSGSTYRSSEGGRLTLQNLRHVSYVDWNWTLLNHTGNGNVNLMDCKEYGAVKNSGLGVINVVSSIVYSVGNYSTGQVNISDSTVYTAKCSKGWVNLTNCFMDTYSVPIDVTSTGSMSLTNCSVMWWATTYGPLVISGKEFHAVNCTFSNRIDCNTATTNISLINCYMQGTSTSSWGGCGLKFGTDDTNIPVFSLINCKLDLTTITIGGVEKPVHDYFNSAIQAPSLTDGTTTKTMTEVLSAGPGQTTVDFEDWTV